MKLWHAVAAILTFMPPAFAAEADEDGTATAPSFHIDFGKGFIPLKGPPPAITAEKGVSFSLDVARPFVRLSSVLFPTKKPVASYKAHGIVPSAQGTISFDLRLPANRPPAKDTRFIPPIISLSGTGGGTWTFKAADVAYREAEDLFEEAPDANLLSAVNMEADEAMDKEALAEKPSAVLCCEIDVNPFAIGQAKAAVPAKMEVFKRGEWHRIIWTWNSVNSTIYIDGKPSGSAQTLSRLQPIKNQEAIFNIHDVEADISNLMIYPRYIEEAQLNATGSDNPAVSTPPFRISADWAFTTGRTVVFADVAGLKDCVSVEFTCKDPNSDKPLKTARMTSFPDGVGEMLVPVMEPSSFPPGTYRYEAVALDKDGKELARAKTADWTAEKKDWQWLGSRAGLEKKVKIIPPFTPIEVKDAVISTLMRKHSLDKTGMFKSIEAAGGELLAAPVTMDVTVGGKTLDFSGGAGLGKIENKEDEADWTAESETPEGHRLRVAGHMEYDGMARFDLTLEPKGKLPADNIVLKIPYRPEIVRLAHTKQTWCFHFVEIVKNKSGGYESKPINWNTYAPKDRIRRTGVVYDSDDIGYVAPVRYPFAPFMHVGNYHRGLFWFVENDKGWIHDLGKIPPVELVCTGQEKYLRINLVAKTSEISAPLNFRFYLLANPYKPLPPDWRTWIIARQDQDDDIAKNTKHRFWYHWSEYAASYFPYPGINEPGKPVDPKKLKTATKHERAGGTTYESWIGKFKDDPLYHIPFINFAYPGGFPSWDKENLILANVSPMNWTMHNNNATITYMAYWLDRCAKEVGIKGCYIDVPYQDPFSYNILAGDTPYLEEDGSRAIGYRFIEGRNYFRRLKQVFADMGIDYSIWGHTTNFKAPFYTFADISMDGEHPQIWCKEFDNYHIYYNPEMSRGYLAGQQFGYVGSMMFHSATNPDGSKDPSAYPKMYRKSRSYLAVTLPYGVLPQTNGISDELHRINNIRYAFGIFDSGLKELTLDEEAQWLGGATFAPDGLRCSGDLNLAKNRALLYVSNTDGVNDRYELSGGFKGLALGKPHAHAWNAETGVSLLVDGKTILETRPLDFSAIWVQGRDQPQKSRPIGALLGVSFDNGPEPDFGGGITPPENVESAKFAPCKSGQALTEGEIGYPVVPDWAAGTLEFDLLIDPAQAKPTRLLALKQHLDLELKYDLKDKKPGLRIRTVELKADYKIYDHLFRTPREPLPTNMLELFVPLEASADKTWRHVTLVWRSGNYDLYLDGSPAGSLSAPAAPKLRSTKSLPAGITVCAAAGIALDSLIAYDWPMAPEFVKGAAARNFFAPIPRPTPSESFPVWIYGDSPDKCMIGVNLANCAYRSRTNLIKFTMTDKKKPDSELGNAELVPWMGSGAGVVKLAPPPVKAVPADGGGTGKDDEMSELLDEMKADENAVRAVVKVELIHKRLDEKQTNWISEPIASRSFDFDFKPGRTKFEH